MKVVLNQIELRDRALKEKYIDLKTTNTVAVLIKHYFNQGKDSEDIKLLLEKFLGDNLKSYIPMKWDKLLSDMIKSISKQGYELYNVESVNITSNELKTIYSLNNLNLEKLAFTLLVHSKVYNIINKNNDNWVKSSNTEIYTDSKMTLKKKDKAILIGELEKLGLISDHKCKRNNSIRVNFLDEASEVTLMVTDFVDFIYEFNRLKGDKIINCGVCKKIIKQNIHNQKFCSECAKKIKNEKDKEYYSLRKQE